MIDRLPRLWCIPLNVTEACLHAGSVLARRIPEVVARILAGAGAVDARWAPLVVEVEEGLGFAVLGIPPDRRELQQHLWDLEGDYLLYGQIELLGERVWLESGLYSGQRDETLIEPHFRGRPEELLDWLPTWASSLADCVGQRELPWDRSWLERPVTRDWSAFQNYCEALDLMRKDARRRDWEWRILSRIFDALRADAGFQLAAELGG